MKTLGIKITFIGIVSVVSVPVSAAQDSSLCNVAALPPQISEALKNKFAQWRPKQISDMEADDQQLWLKGPNAKECPGIAIGNFETAKEPSYAVLLVPKSEPTSGYKILVFSKATGDAFAWKLMDHADGETYSGLVISRAEPGKYSDFERTKSIQTKLDGVYVEWMGKGAVLYYWSAGRYHTLPVSD